MFVISSLRWPGNSGDHENTKERKHEKEGMQPFSFVLSLFRLGVAQFLQGFLNRLNLLLQLRHLVTKLLHNFGRCVFYETLGT
jgi:hypothetical protein